MVRGLGLRVGDVAMDDGDGVRASGDSGMLCTDFLLCGDLTVCSLCFKPCSELGLLKCADPAGELGVLELGELELELVSPVDRAPLSEADGDQTRLSGGDLGERVGEPGSESPELRDRDSDVKLRLGVSGDAPLALPRCCSARLELRRRKSDVRRFLSSDLVRWCFFFVERRAILPAHKEVASVETNMMNTCGTHVEVCSIQTEPALSTVH